MLAHVKLGVKLTFADLPVAADVIEREGGREGENASEQVFSLGRMSALGT